MVWPRVSILWLNYNSMRIIDVVGKSLKAIAELDYPNYELIIVDNGSVDGSYEEVKKIAEKLPVDKKIIRLEKNLGFTGGNNVAYRARDPDAKYVVLLNNDAVPEASSLRELVECIESFDGVGAVQGVIVNMDTGMVDSAGGLLTELLISYPLFHGMNPSVVSNGYYIVYADGAYSLYRVEAVKKATGYPDKIFYDELFAYLDDTLLGLQLWNTGFKVVSCPIITGFHKRSSSFGSRSLKHVYLHTRNYIALNEVCNSRYKSIIKRLFLKSLLTRSLSGSMVSSSIRTTFSILYRAYINGVRIGEKISRRSRVDIYKAPVIYEEASKALVFLLTGLGVEYLKRVYYNHLMEKLKNRIIQKLRINSL